MKNAWVAFGLSLLVPGLGQLYLGEKPKAISLLSITAGFAVGFAFTRSAVALILVGSIYLFVMIPVALDAYRTASGKPRAFKHESVLYVLFMLVAVGPFAIPLLWNTPNFSKGWKVFLTVFVTVVAVAAVLATVFLASTLDQAVKQNPWAMPV